jgi:hypothetical protein
VVRLDQGWQCSATFLWNEGTRSTELIIRNVGFRNVMDRAMPESNGKLPELVFAFYQMVRPDLPATLQNTDMVRPLPASYPQS